MKKRSIAARLGIAAMALTLITTSLSSGTLAKYTTTVSASTTMQVAKWNVVATNAGGTELTAESPLSLGALASTATKGDGGEVSTGKIAPGMEGSFKINLGTTGVTMNSTTDVDVQAVVKIKADKKLPSGFKMSAGTMGEKSIGTSDETLLTKTWDAGQQINWNSNTDENQVTVNWKWLYEGASDADDTEAGETFGDTNVTFTITVVFTQVQPTDKSA